LSIEEKFDEIRALMAMGKEKGYLLYEEINELLPADVTSAEELDDLFSALNSAGIEVVDSEKSYRDDKGGSADDTEGGGPSGDLDLTPGVLDKTNDPVRMYLREMGTVPLLTREGEVAIAHRVRQAHGHEADLPHIEGDPGGHRDGRAAQTRRAHHPRAGRL